MDEGRATALLDGALLRSLEEAPAFFEGLGADLPEARARWKPAGEPSGDDWSLLEHLCHLLEIERAGYTRRIDRILREERPFLEDLDGDKLFAQGDYNSCDWADTLRDFLDERRANIRRVASLSAGELNRGGVFEGVGPVTLVGLVHMMREHDEDHLGRLERRGGRGE